MQLALTKTLKHSAATIALVAGAMTAVQAVASEVTLKSTDGTFNVTGEFISYENDEYIVRTSLGDLRVAGSRVACEGAACPVFDDLVADVTIAGSEAIGLGLMPLLMTGYAANLDAELDTTNPSVDEAVSTLIGEGGFGDDIGTFVVSSLDDRAAFASLLEGEAKIGMSSRRIEKDEARALRNAGAGSMVSPSQEHIIAIDTMVVATHASNEVDSLTMEQLRGVFSGEIRNWSELGGPDRPINVIMRNDDSASYDFFMSYLFGSDRPEFLPQGIASDDQGLSNVLYSDRNAIGYLGFAFQRGTKPVSIVNECGIATTPDAFSAKTEEYALNRRMYLYNRGDNLDAQSQAFLDFVLSEAADGVIAKSGFIDLGVDRVSQSLDEGRGALLAAEAARYDAGYEGEVIQEMLDEKVKHDRLSTTFRFRTGSSKIDERGRLDMSRLVEYLQDVPPGTTVTLVGFTDDVGAFEANRQLSFGRAEQVAKDLRAYAGDRLDHIEFATTGFGEIAPSACNVNDRGRSINRRVEVWISKGPSG